MPRQALGSADRSCKRRFVVTALGLCAALCSCGQGLEEMRDGMRPAQSGARRSTQFTSAPPHAWGRGRTRLYHGPRVLKGMRLTPLAILIGFEDGIVAMTRDGETTDQWSPPEQSPLKWLQIVEPFELQRDRVRLGTDRYAEFIVIAIVGDTVQLLDQDLEPLDSMALGVPCDNPVYVPPARLVCPSTEPRDDDIWTYDLANLEKLNSHSQIRADNVPGRWIPGTSDIILASHRQTPRDFDLFTVNDDGTVDHISEMPTHGEIDASPIFALDLRGEPKILNHEGQFMLLRGPGCDGEGTSVDEDCFIDLGRRDFLLNHASFLHAELDANGLLYALTSSPSGIINGPYPWDTDCKFGCAIQVFDFDTQELLSQQVTQDLAIKAMVASAHDEASQTLIAAYAELVEFGEDPRYIVDMFGYAAE